MLMLQTITAADQLINFMRHGKVAWASRDDASRGFTGELHLIKRRFLAVIRRGDCRPTNDNDE
jgi:hypothetical protein